MNKKKYIEFTLPIEKVISQNNYLNPSSKYIYVRGQKVLQHYLYKNPDIKYYQECIENYIWDNYYDYVKDNQELFKEEKYIEQFEFQLTDNITKRDVTNSIKNTEDAIVVGINWILQDIGSEYTFDDSQIYLQRNAKKLIKGDTEVIRFQLKPYKTAKLIWESER